MSLSELSFNSSVKGVQGGLNRSNRSISQVGKAGLPPLFTNANGKMGKLVNFGGLSKSYLPAFAFFLLDIAPDS